MEVNASVASRPAESSDLEAIVAVYFAAWHANLGHLFPDGVITEAERDDRRATVSTWLDDGASMDVIVATIDDDVVGYTAFEGDQVVHLFISPEAQGVGVGRRLLELAVSAIATDGHSHARLFTLEFNERAIGFYTAIGWTLTDITKPGVYFGQAMHEVMLIRPAA